jgi:hypothetical protein
VNRALAADVAPWEIALVLTEVVGAFAGAFMIAIGTVDILRPRVQSMHFVNSAEVARRAALRDATRRVCVSRL